MRYSKVFRILPVLFGLMILSVGSVIFAQPKQCPAPLRTGIWSSEMTAPVDFDYSKAPNGANKVQSAMAKMMFEQMASAMTAQNVNVPEPVRIIGDVCSGGFTLDTGEVAFEMSPIGQETDGSIQYRGTTGRSENGAQIDLYAELVSDGPTNASGLSGGRIKALTLGIDGGWEMPIAMSHADEATEPLACQCRELLEAEIAEMVADAVYLRDIYANPKYRQRPPGFPTPTDVPQIDPNELFDPWGGPRYERLLTLMETGELSYLEAAKHLASEMDSNGNHADKPVTKLDAATGTMVTKAIKTESAAETSLKTCDITHNTDHSEYCFSEVAIEADEVHEKVHQTICIARYKNDSLTETWDVNVWADEEVQAYQKGIDHLKNWITANCTG